jgi:eukaryotic-like serine/threonine-protein kinase
MDTQAADFDEQSQQAEVTLAVGLSSTSAGFPTVPGYRILAEIGRGGMGVVYRAVQLGANRDVALKMILAGDRAGAEDIARFRLEAEAVARLQHPNIVAVHEVGEHAGLPFFSMEFCTGGSLANLISQRAVSPQEACGLLLKVARGAAAAHAAGIVHRDLKPQNVLLAADGTPKITDFGLAKRMSAAGAEVTAGLTQTGAMLGTPAYMAPEQAFGDSKNVGPESDVYALGAMLYTMLVGRPPFVGPTPLDTMLKVVTEEPESPRSLRRDVPQDLEVVCMKCLEKDRRKRYRSARELADDLARFLDGEAVSAVRSGILSRMVGAMDRVQLQERFASFGTILLALAPVMALPEILVAMIFWNQWPTYLLPIVQVARLAAFVAVVAAFRKGRLLPQGPAERHLWMVLGGYVLACFAMGFGSRLASHQWSSNVEVRFYQPLAALTALAFFALAATTWGYCAAIGLGFVGLVFVMAIDLQYASLEFGAAWTVVLVLLGLRLRALGKGVGADASRNA